MRFEELALLSQRLASTRSRNAKVEQLALLLKALEQNEVEPAVALLAGEPRQGRIGVGGALLRRVLAGPVAPQASASIAEVDAVLQSFAALSGRGSQGEREALLGALYARLTEPERELLTGALAGGLRQGALEAVVLDGVARAAQLPIEALRRALLFAGSVQRVAAAALFGGAAKLAQFSLQLFQPLRPMLADSAATLSEALGQTPSAAIEYKLDGARIQVHKAGQDVAVFSRQGQDVSARVPEIAESVRGLDARELVLDGEAIALGEGGRPLPFQTTMQRFGRRKGVEQARTELPLSLAFFDCLCRDGQLLVDAPNSERFAALLAAAGESRVVARHVVHDEAGAQRFVAQALEAGHEGVLVKSLDAPYDAGRRGASWLKLKPVHTLDLVVLAVERGSGRRQGFLSNIHLGARDAERGGFVMLGKTFKGMTDAMLAWQTERFQQLAIDQGGYVVTLRPEQVVEVAFDGVQESPQYPGGLSLRFARVKRYRDDKRANEADTIARVREIFEASRR